jgi:hypothetical protein
MTERGPLLSSKRGLAGKKALIHAADRLSSYGHFSGRKSQHGIGFIERHKPIQIARVAPYYKESAKILGPSSSLTFAIIAHADPPWLAGPRPADSVLLMR